MESIPGVAASEVGGCQSQRRVAHLPLQHAGRVGAGHYVQRLYGHGRLRRSIQGRAFADVGDVSSCERAYHRVPHWLGPVGRERQRESIRRDEEARSSTA